jgi:hypothetical protein
MADQVTASWLLGRARAAFDNDANSLAQQATRAWQTGFGSGGRWMWRAMECLRGESLPGPRFNLNLLGVSKYGLACGAAACPVALAVVVRQPLIAVLAVPAFYAVEVQMVFLFPLAVSGCQRPFRESRRWTRLAGGTLSVMWVVLQLAATMLFGGFAGRGFVRSWCLGCLAVCIWFEKLRIEQAEPASDRVVGTERPQNVITR